MTTLDMETLDRELEGEGDLIEKAMQRAVRDALRRHKRLGQPVVVWQDGKTVWLQPEEIQVIDESEEEDLVPTGINGNGHISNGAGEKDA